jgi:hemoglobin
MTLLNQLGGREAVEMVVAAFYERVLADPLLKHYFRGVQMSRLYAHQADFFCAVLGNQDCYRGRDMRTIHAGMNISDAEFDAVAMHLSTALAECGAGQAQIDAVIGLVAPLRKDVVTRPAAPALTPMQREFLKPAATCPLSRVKAAFPWRSLVLAIVLIVAALAGAIVLKVV